MWATVYVDLSINVFAYTRITRSPDSGAYQANQEIWRGSISMAGLAKFTANAYPVSGPVEYINEVSSHPNVMIALSLSVWWLSVCESFNVVCCSPGSS